MITCLLSSINYDDIWFFRPLIPFYDFKNLFVFISFTTLKFKWAKQTHLCWMLCTSIKMTNIMNATTIGDFFSSISGSCWSMFSLLNFNFQFRLFTLCHRGRFINYTYTYANVWNIYKQLIAFLGIDTIFHTLNATLF